MLAMLPHAGAVAASLVEPCQSLELCRLTGCGYMTALGKPMAMLEWEIPRIGVGLGDGQDWE
jgi:hypothetical protein